MSGFERKAKVAVSKYKIKKVASLSYAPLNPKPLNPKPQTLKNRCSGLAGTWASEVCRPLDP